MTDCIKGTSGQKERQAFQWKLGKGHMQEIHRSNNSSDNSVFRTECPADNKILPASDTAGKHFTCLITLNSHNGTSLY